MEKLGITPKEKFGKVRLSEVFVSVQGEGPRTGEPTSFVRTAACNVRCPGWGVETTLPDGTKVVGCDSPHSVFPEIFMQPGASTNLEPHEVVERVPDWPRNVCLTGGEPLLQRKAVTAVVEELVAKGHTIDVFTNGTIRVPTDLSDIWTHPNVSFVMDYKPKWSGVTLPFQTENFQILREQDSVKFVCKNREDYEEALRIVEQHPEFKGKWFVGAVLGIMKPQTLVEWMVKDQVPNLHLNLQTQAYLSLDVPISNKSTNDSFDEKERYMHRIVG